MIRFFKIIATLEGISLLVLLFIAYIYRVQELIRPIGMAHGVLFIVYVLLALILHLKLRWPVKQFLIINLAAFIPFGTFYIEWKYFSAKK